MKRLNPFLIVTGLIGMVANILAILGYLSGERSLAGWRPNPGLVLALSIVLMAFGLVIWSTLVWRWNKRDIGTSSPNGRRAAMFLLNGLATFPLLTFWLDLLFSIVLYVDVPSPQRWLLALAHAWIVTPFAALGLTFVGETLGPLLVEKG